MRKNLGTTGYIFKKYSTSANPVLLQQPRVLQHLPPPDSTTTKTLAHGSTTVPRGQILRRYTNTCEIPAQRARRHNDPRGHPISQRKPGTDITRNPGLQLLVHGTYDDERHRQDNRPYGDEHRQEVTVPVPVPPPGRARRAVAHASSSGHLPAVTDTSTVLPRTVAHIAAPTTSVQTAAAVHSECVSPHQIAQGKRRRLMNPEPWMRFHPFVATLEQWAAGVSAQCGDRWTTAAIEAAVARGPHTSALTPDARQLIADEMEYQVAAGFSEIVPWTDLQAMQPPHLKISPLAVIPQVGRRGRLLLDLSFAVQRPHSPSKRARRAQITTAPLAPSVNETTLQQSPEYPVKELGRVLPESSDSWRKSQPKRPLCLLK
jgi:hypothetical protein